MSTAHPEPGAGIRRIKTQLVATLAPAFTADTATKTDDVPRHR